MCTAISCTLSVYIQFSVVLFIHAVLSCDAMPSASPPTLRHKAYDQNLLLACPGCANNQCSITINGYNHTTNATLHNDQLELQPRDWSNYGIICCGLDSDQQSCYQVCPQLNGEICLYTSTIYQCSYIEHVHV